MILFECVDCGAHRQQYEVTQDPQCGAFHCRGEHDAPRRYEVADFDPADGHLHACLPHRRPCNCAALARDLAEDLASSRERAIAVAVRLEEELAEHKRRRCGVGTSAR